MVLEKIFYGLDSLNEMIRCSCVCKNWRAAYEVFKPTTLCLHSKAFKLLNYRLAYSTQRVRRCEFFKTSSDLQFLASEITRTHFANIRKLVILSPNRFEYRFVYHPFSFGKQLNHFQKLEYLELQKGICLQLEDSELDLPMLKVLCFNAMRKKKYLNDVEYNEEVRQEVLLNTPSLEVFEVQPYDGPNYFSDFVFKFPHQLRSLTAILMGGEFDPKTKFEQLECLAVKGSVYGKLRENLLSFFPNLKLLLLFTCHIVKQLIEQKKRFGLDNLEILINDTEDYDFTLDHVNWRKYVRYEGTVQYCPIEFSVDFNKFVEHAVPLNLFKSFFRLNILKLGRVVDQSLLLDFLRIVKTFYTLYLTPEFNLDEHFFDQVASFLTVHRLRFPENVLNRLSDYTFLEKFNFSVFSLKFENLPREQVSFILKKLNCQINFQFDMDSLERQPEDDWILLNYDHFIERHPALGFVCSYCDWASARDLDANSNPIEATIRHVEYHWVPGDPFPLQNVTPEEYQSV